MQTAAKIDPQNMTQFFFKLCHPRTNRAPDSDRDRQEKLETKRIVPCQTMHTGRISVSLPRAELITFSIITIRLVQNLRPIVYVLLNFDRNFANLVAPPTDRTEKNV